MKRVSLLKVFLLLFLLSFSAVDAMAIGLGFNLSAGGGTTEWDVEDQYFYTEWEDDSDDSRGAIGFIFDTAVAKKSIFNYRLNVGSESVSYDFDLAGKYEASGWFMAHDFGFAILRKKNLRLWAGPEIRLSYVKGEHETFSDRKIEVFSIGIGPVVGLNVNFKKGLTLALKAGILSMGSGGEIDYKSLPLDPDLEIGGSGGYSFINIGLIFRIGDEYKK